MNRTVTRRITNALAGTITAAGILIGSLVVGVAAEAGAQPTSGTQCSSMTMPAGQADADNLNPLTRAGQISSAGSTVSSTGGGAPMDCQAVGHS